MTVGGMGFTPFDDDYIYICVCVCWYALVSTICQTYQHCRSAVRVQDRDGN